jgi:serine phosphatase RsbU (regulator of sigma subunit)
VGRAPGDDLSFDQGAAVDPGGAPVVPGEVDLRTRIDLRDPVAPALDDLELLGRNHVADQGVAGGDFVDVVRATWGTALTIGDVCGKGHSVANDAGAARLTLRRLMSADPNPAAALAALNSLLSPAAQPGPVRGHDARYVTAVAAAVRTSRLGRDVTVAVGGHPRPLVLRRAGRTEIMGSTGPIIGWFADGRFTTMTCPLWPGDTLVLYTDGCLGTEGADEGRLARSMARLTTAPLAEIAGVLEADLTTDDAAFLLARVR